jgi:hypothetical protein
MLGEDFRRALTARAVRGKAINGGFDLLEAKCNRCDRVSLVPLRARPRIIQLEAGKDMAASQRPEIQRSDRR